MTAVEDTQTTKEAVNHDAIVKRIASYVREGVEVDAQMRQLHEKAVQVRERALGLAQLIGLNGIKELQEAIDNNDHDLATIINGAESRITDNGT